MSSRNEGVDWNHPQKVMQVSNATHSLPADESTPGNGVVLSSGRILLLGTTGYVVASDDGGKSFHMLDRLESTIANGETEEPQAAELPQGELYLLGHRLNWTPQGGLVSAAAVSTNKGRSWTGAALQNAFNLTTCMGGLSSTRPMWSKSPPVLGLQSTPLATSNTKGAVPDNKKALTTVARTYDSTLFFSHPNVPASIMAKSPLAGRYNGTIWRSINGGVGWTAVSSLTGNSFTPPNLFTYSVMTPIGEIGATAIARNGNTGDGDGRAGGGGARVAAKGMPTVLMGVLYETGDAARCGEDPRFHTPSTSCIIVFKAVDLPLL
jgi:hypothetical protein